MKQSNSMIFRADVESLKPEIMEQFERWKQIRPIELAKTLNRFNYETNHNDRAFRFAMEELAEEGYLKKGKVYKFVKSYDKQIEGIDNTFSPIESQESEIVKQLRANVTILLERMNRFEGRGNDDLFSEKKMYSGRYNTDEDIQKSSEFDKELENSLAVLSQPIIEEILLKEIPGSSQVMRTNKKDDIDGVDLWVEMPGYWIGVDGKTRKFDPIEKGYGDELALEIWSNIQKQIPGWTLDKTKKTDYVLFFWCDTKRWCLVPFMLLRKAMEENLERWKNEENYHTSIQKTRSKYNPNKILYESECIFVPRKEVFKAMWRGMYGKETISQ